MHIRDVRKSGTFHIPIKKNRVSHILFVEKRGLIYLAALKMGTILVFRFFFFLFFFLETRTFPSS